MTGVSGQGADQDRARANAVDLARQAAVQAEAAGCDRDAAALYRIVDRLEANRPRRRLVPHGSPGARLRAQMAKRGGGQG